MFTQLKAHELHVDHKVRLFDGPYGTGTVYATDGDQVLISRPYCMVHHGVPLVGSEKMVFFTDSSRFFNVYTESLVC